LGFCQCWLNDRRIIWCVNYTTLEISRFCWSANQVDFENGYNNGCMYIRVVLKHMKKTFFIILFVWTPRVVPFRLETWQKKFEQKILIFRGSSNTLYIYCCSARILHFWCRKQLTISGMGINADIVTWHYNYLDISVKRSAISSQHITNKVSVYHAEWWGAGVGADLHMAQLIPLPLTVSCFSKIQIGFTFLVPAHLGSPRKRSVKWVCVCLSRFLASGNFPRFCSITWRPYCSCSHLKHPDFAG